MIGRKCFGTEHAQSRHGALDMGPAMHHLTEQLGVKAISDGSMSVSYIECSKLVLYSSVLWLCSTGEYYGICLLQSVFIIVFYGRMFYSSILH